MKIRSITYFLNPGWPLDMEAFEAAGKFRAAAQPAFESAGYEVETTRLATNPFPQFWVTGLLPDAVQFALAVEETVQAQGYNFVSIGPALIERHESYAAVPDILAATSSVFVSGMMASPEKGISLPAVRLCAEIIRRASSLSSDGFANLRFAALANVPAGAPFFPAAYHLDNTPIFALALESADLAVKALSGAAGLDDARAQLIAEIEKNARLLTAVSEELSSQFKIPFSGLDFSLATFPDAARSIGAAIEAMGVSKLGMQGSLAAVAILADSLDKAHYRRVGFNGVMLPVMEDAVLAARAAEGLLAVNDLLLYSAVCGTGIDTVPLPGDIPAEQLAPILLDLAALSQRLAKPLTARLMPIPGKSAGDPTGFNFDYFGNSRVMGVKAAPLSGPLAGGESIQLEPKKIKN
ncbi:MAG: DUF711 family protein [Omnitrophica WOR_2 bacterium]